MIIKFVFHAFQNKNNSFKIINEILIAVTEEIKLYKSYFIKTDNFNQKMNVLIIVCGGLSVR